MLRRIFNAYGESDFAEDDVLLQEMIEAAASGGGGDGDGGGDVLDLASFASALSYDIKEYNTKNETFCTTNFDDVMLTQRGYEIEKGQDADLMSRELSLADVESRKSKATFLWKIFTAPAIDSTAGTQRTKSLSTILWVTGKTHSCAICGVRNNRLPFHPHRNWFWPSLSQLSLPTLLTFTNQ